MLEELGWLLLFLLFFGYSHYQIKYCVPITLFLLKFIQAAVMLITVKLYVVYRLYGNDLTGDLKDWVYTFVNASQEVFNSKFEL